MTIPVLVGPLREIYIYKCTGEWGKKERAGGKATKMCVRRSLAWFYQELWVSTTPQRLCWRWMNDWAVIFLHQPVIGQGLPQGMGAVASQASLDEADVISQVQFATGRCKCEKLAGNIHSSWRVGAPAHWSGSEWGTNSTYSGSFSHVEESVFP